MTSITAILPIIGLALIGTLLAVFLKESRLPVLGLLIVLTVGAVIFLRLLSPLTQLLETLQSISTKSGFNSYYFMLVLKIIGIAYTAEFGAQLCRDAGQGAVAIKVEFAAKIGIMLIALPIMSAILQSVLRLLA